MRASRGHGLGAALAIVAILPIATPGAALAQITWTTVAPGVSYAEWSPNVGEPKSPLSVSVVRCEPAQVKLQVIGVYSALRAPMATQSRTYTLLDVWKKFPRMIAAINGGFTATYSLPIPAGLVVQDGKVVTGLNARSSSQSGVFCVGPDGADIIAKASFKNGVFAQAIQSGPIVIERPGKNGIDLIERKSPPYRRSVIGLDQQGRLLLIATGEAHLYDIAGLMLKSEAQGGLGCTAALNLSGGIESGLRVRLPAGERSVGSTDTQQIASAIAILPIAAPLRARHR
jgi:uncharacterized protein YigE (DUF2233 family)